MSNNIFMKSIENFAHANGVEIPAAWLEHWNSTFQKVAHMREIKESCTACATEWYTRPNSLSCPQCGQIARPWQEGAAIFAAMAGVLGHGWVTDSVLETPRNLTEIKCISDAFNEFNEWGYNPPLTYKNCTVSTRQPWLVESITHRTSKQIIVARESYVDFSLTTTTGLPVVQGQLSNDSYAIKKTKSRWFFNLSNFNVANLIDRPDRLMWAETYARNLDVEVAVIIDSHGVNNAAAIAACLPRKAGDDGLNHTDKVWQAIFAEEAEQAKYRR
jgi:hypothetical protein